MAIDCTDSGATFAESEANGRLIASAPGLAAALTVVLQALDEATVSGSDDANSRLCNQRDTIHSLLQTAGVII